ncbi:hypothetical protein HX021_16075 [Sphingobacterium sp. N143]|uniref:hypothetical protein n=1 Tax=Sphingobacterium sp. N143 TaxID=2746727 RepID=UPI0025754508|nr:hypothetical protein [Sphingobacterium sp. N143]MDM1295807.1 hypothetical protein [Sphingobacterium sp. N143]
MKKTIASLLLALPFNIILAQSIKGTVEIDMKDGLINCSFQLNDIPPIKNYKILLNKGMNIKNFKDSDQAIVWYDGHYDGEMKGEALAYTLLDNEGKIKQLPSSFQVDYKGAFPVYFDSAEDYGPFDYKGIIAFNGKTLRAADQSKWYPVLYDVDSDKLVDKYRYEITIKVKNADNNSIFINGNAPQKTMAHQFTSAKPSTLLLFVGNYNFVSNEAGYILNLAADQKTVAAIFDNIDLIKAKLAKNLDSKFTDKIYIINHKAVNKRKPGSSWAFNDYPAFAFTDLDPAKLMDEKGQFTSEYIKFFGHELAHNYFGASMLSGKLSWFWLESFAEYLSFNVTEDAGFKDYLKEVLLRGAKYVENQNFIPLTEISEVAQINVSYRYVLAPLMLKCFEDTFGRDKTNHVLKSLLEYAKTQTLTLELFDKAVEASGIGATDFQKFKQQFIADKDFKQHIIAHIRKHYS